MQYKHKVVSGLAELIERYGGNKSGDPFMRAVWFGIKGQVPMLLNALDNSEEAVGMIEDKLREVLDIKEPEPSNLPTAEQIKTVRELPIPKPKRIAFIGNKTPGKRRRRVIEKPVAEVEVIVEPEVSND